MGYKDLLPYNNRCEHSRVAFDEEISKDGKIRRVEVECRQCGDRVVDQSEDD